MRLRKRAPLENEPLVNLTPLIDVVFVVLIVFMLVAPMVNIDQITLAPKAKSLSTTIDEKKQLVIRLHADGSLSLNKQIIPSGHLSSAILRAKSSGKKALLLCDKRANFGSYQAVKDALEEAGFEELDIAVSPKR